MQNISRSGENGSKDLRGLAFMENMHIFTFPANISNGEDDGNHSKQKDCHDDFIEIVANGSPRFGLLSLIMCVILYATAT